MSGGSFEYLCSKEGEDLFQGATIEQLDRMAEALRAYPNGHVAADETQALADYLRRVTQRAMVLRKALKDVWHAVEWHHSADMGPDFVAEKLKAYHEGDKG